MRTFGCFGLFFVITNILLGQVERIYNEDGQLKAVRPLNEEGLYDGLGVLYYPDGTVEEETPYIGGEVHGIVRRYTKDGSLQAEIRYVRGVPDGLERMYHPDGGLETQREWEDGQLKGNMVVYDSYGHLRMRARMHSDSVVFAQRFDDEGKLTNERVGAWGSLRLDTTDLLPLRVFAEDGFPLKANAENALQVVIPGIPQTLMSLSCEGGQLVDTNGSLPYPIVVIPAPDAEYLTIYARISMRPGAAPAFMRKSTVNIAF